MCPLSRVVPRTPLQGEQDSAPVLQTARLGPDGADGLWVIPDATWPPGGRDIPTLVPTA